MGPRSKTKKTRKSIMKSKGKSNFYAVLGICIACLPVFVLASQIDEGFVIGQQDPFIESDDLEAAESQNIGAVRPQPGPVRPQPGPVPAQVGFPAVAPAASSVAPATAALAPAGFSIPKRDLASAPSYAPRYVVPPVNPYRERLPYEVAHFRRRATEDEDRVEDDYQPSESKGKKQSPSIAKRVRNSIRNTGKAIVGAPSYILKRYRGTWKKLFGGGGKKKKGGWKSYSSSDKSDGWGWEEAEPAGGWEPSHYPTEKGYKASKGWSSGKGWDSHERRYDREQSSYKDYRDRDDYDEPRPRDRPREKSKWTSSYKEETHYDDYDGRRTTASYGPPKKSTRRPSSSSGSYKYDDDY